MSIRSILVAAAFALAALEAVQSLTLSTPPSVDALEITRNGDSALVRKVKSISK